MNDWKRVSDKLPPEGREVETKIDDARGVRNVQTLIRRGRLWWTDSIYVYYTPTHWRYLTTTSGEGAT